MLSQRLVRLARLDRLRPAATVSARAIALVYAARFVDEVASGAWEVLLPAFRRDLELSLLQVGLLGQVLAWLALVVEPVSASRIDVASRRVQMAVGAAALAVSLALMAASPSYAVLLVAFACFAVGSGPLAQTADVLVVEIFPEAPARAFARAAFVDTVGAMAGPALVGAVLLVGVSWRVALAGLAGGIALYALALRSCRMPEPRRTTDPAPPLAHTVASVRAALAQREMRRALAALLCFEVVESAFVLKYVWLHDDAGLSDGAVAAWAVLEQLVDLAALLALDRWLVNGTTATALRRTALALVVLPPAWVLAPGLAGVIVVAIPLAFARTLVWPLAKARLLVTVPELAGAGQAVTSLYALLPLALVQGTLAERIGPGTAMALTASAGAVAMLAVLRGEVSPSVSR